MKRVNEYIDPWREGVRDEAKGQHAATPAGQSKVSGAQAGGHISQRRGMGPVVKKKKGKKENRRRRGDGDMVLRSEPGGGGGGRERGAFAFRSAPFGSLVCVLFYVSQLESVLYTM